jgi:hypothetical protein
MKPEIAKTRPLAEDFLFAAARVFGIETAIMIAPERTAARRSSLARRSFVFASTRCGAPRGAIAVTLRARERDLPRVSGAPEILAKLPLIDALADEISRARRLREQRLARIYYTPEFYDIVSAELDARGLTLAQFRGPSRALFAVAARKAIFARTKRELSLSYVDIGLMSDRHRTAVMHHVRGDSRKAKVAA